MPGWYQPPKTEKETRLWDQRLEEITTYMTTHDRWPTYRKGQKDLPNVLAAWLWAQRRRHRGGTLPQARVESLNAQLPTWYQPLPTQ
ncbi:hypothetical protein GCM10009611_09720 [Arthrobacter roseus]